MANLNFLYKNLKSANYIATMTMRQKLGNSSNLWFLEKQQCMSYLMIRSICMFHKSLY